MIFSRTRKAGRHEIAPAEPGPVPEDHPSPLGNVTLFATDEDPHVGPAAPPRRVWRKVPTAPYVEVHAPHTPPPQPATGPAAIRDPRPYTPEPVTPPRRRYVSPPRKAAPKGPVTVPARLYPGYDGTAEQYARLMRLCDTLTGTTSDYGDPKAWPRHALTAPKISGDAA